MVEVARAKMVTTAKFLAFSCVHQPDSSSNCVGWLLRKIAEHKPTHLVCLGDLFDAKAASVHPDEDVCSLRHEYAEAASFLRRAREAGGDPVCIWTLGNHDDNIQKADPRRIPKALRESVHWNQDKLYGDEFQRWAQYPYIKSSKAVYSLGQVMFFHGFDCAANSDELEGLQMNYACGGSPWRLSVRGHTHRPVSPTQAKRTAKVLLPHWYANVGTIGYGDKQPEYMSRKDCTQWGAAVLVGEALLGKRVSRCTSREWSASLELMS